VKGLTVCTFHALGVRIVRQEAKLLGLKPQFSILDASDTTQIIAELTGNTDKNRAKALQWQISSWKNALISPTRPPTGPTTRSPRPPRCSTATTTRPCAPTRASTSTT
jgi:superfamily I DNA/RNA helicase